MHQAFVCHFVCVFFVKTMPAFVAALNRIVLITSSGALFA